MKRVRVQLGRLLKLKINFKSAPVDGADPQLFN